MYLIILYVKYIITIIGKNPIIAISRITPIILKAF